MWALSSIFEPDLTSKRRPTPRLRGSRTATRGAPSDVPQQSTCRQITAVWGASRPTSGAVASTPLFIGKYIYGDGEQEASLAHHAPSSSPPAIRFFAPPQLFPSCTFHPPPLFLLLAPRPDSILLFPNG